LGSLDVQRYGTLIISLILWVSNSFNDGQSTVNRSVGQVSIAAKQIKNVFKSTQSNCNGINTRGKLFEYAIETIRELM